MCLVQLCFKVLGLKSELHYFFLVLGTVVTLTLLHLWLIQRSHGVFFLHRLTVCRVVLFINFQLIVKLVLQIPSPIFKEKHTLFFIFHMRCSKICTFLRVTVFFYLSYPGLIVWIKFRFRFILPYPISWFTGPVGGRT